MFRNVLRMVSELIKTTIVPLYSGDGENKAAFNRRVSRRLFASTVIRHPAGETKLSIERLSVRRGHFHREPSHRSAVGPGRRRS